MASCRSNYFRQGRLFYEMRELELPNSHDMVIQRHLCGIIGLLLFGIGAALCLRESSSSSTVFASASLRAGTLLMVTWLAWPKLIQWREGVPRVALTALFLLALVLVVRPSWGKIAAVLTIAAVGGSVLSRWLATWKHGRNGRQ